MDDPGLHDLNGVGQNRPWSALEDPENIRRIAATGYAVAFRLFLTPEWTALMTALKAGDKGAVKASIVFLEVDPYFQFSGYEKERKYGHLSHIDVPEDDADRLRRFVYRRCAAKVYRHEFRKLRVLARSLATPGFLETLRALPRSEDPDAARAEETFLESVEKALRDW